MGFSFRLGLLAGVLAVTAWTSTLLFTGASASSEFNVTDSQNTLGGAPLVLTQNQCPTLFTSFESHEIGNPPGDFTLGQSPSQVAFSNGRAQSLGILTLYYSGIRSWMVSTGNTGTITFETPAQEVNFFFRDQSSTVNSVLTVLDTDGGTVVTLDGTEAQWTGVNIDIGPGMSPISSITLQHNGPSGNTVIDDFSFCAQASPTPLDDPIPEPIQPGSIPIRLETVAEGLTAPNWGTFAPGDSQRLFVTDQDGTLWAIDLSTGQKAAFLDVSGRLVSLGIAGPNSFDERGLLGVAFHPQYAANGLLYTYTSEPVSGDADFSTMPQGTTANHQSVILEWQVPDPTNPASVVDPGSARELLRIDQPQFNHDGGAVNFGPDGMLYISLGDGGSADDQGTGHGAAGNGQDPGNVLGAVLRIDPAGSNSANGQYGIPADNPFVGQAGFVQEIFAYGFRNPFRFSFDTATGDMLIADVGQNDIEEIDLGVAGGNYGWNLKEGTFCFDPNADGPGFVFDQDPCPGEPPDLIDPIAQYDHDEGIAVIGGFVYRGSQIPALQGRYIFGEFSQQFSGNNGRLFHLMAGEIVEFPLIGQDTFGRSLLGFGQDANGEVYALANGTGVPFGDTGVVLKLTAGQCGDQNNDGNVDVFDAIIDLQIIVGLVEPTAEQQVLSDVVRDGQIDVFDVILMLQSIVGLTEITECGPQL